MGYGWKWDMSIKCYNVLPFNTVRGCIVLPRTARVRRFVACCPMVEPPVGKIIHPPLAANGLSSLRFHLPPAHNHLTPPRLLFRRRRHNQTLQLGQRGMDTDRKLRRSQRLLARVSPTITATVAARADILPFPDKAVSSSIPAVGGRCLLTEAA